MDIISSGIRNSRSKSRSRSRNRSPSTSRPRRPSLASKRSLSSSSLTITGAGDGSEIVIPSVNAILDNSLPLDFFKQDIWELVKVLRISKWHKKSLDPKQIVVNRISGALTNSIYKIEYKDGSLRIPSLLLRVYGKNVDEIIDRERELEVLVKLSAKNIGPRLLGTFVNGRFEQFYEGFVALDRHQIRDQVISQMIGRRMKDLHYKIQLDYKDYKDNMPMCWNLIQKWINIYETDLRDNFLAHGIEDKDIFLTDYASFKKSIFAYRDWLFGKYSANGFAANFKFCHNDTQYGNLLVHSSFNPKDIILEEDETGVNTSNKKDHSLVVIDFEYGGANFPAFDLANHMSEWMANYHDSEKSYFLKDEWFPTKEEQINLLRAYVEYDFQYPSSNLKVDSEPDFTPEGVSKLREFEIKKLYNECVFWRASVQIMWGFWGLIQNGPIAKKDIVDELGSTSEEKGVSGTYTITTGVSLMEINEHTVEEEISSADDQFDYIKYAQQKMALANGDMISFGIVDKQDIDCSVAEVLKTLDSELFDLNI